MCKHYLRFIAGALAVALSIVLLPRLSMADPTGGKLPMPQVQGPTQALESQPLVLTFRYTYPYGHKSGDLSFQWQSWYCEPGKGGAPSNITIDESPWPGTGCTSPVVRGGLLSTGNSVATIRFDVTQPGAWYVRARLLSRQSGNGPWGNWHRTDVHLQQPGALLARPVIDWPYYGTEIIGKGVSLALNPGTGREDDDNWEYQLDWQRARVTTEFNNAYVRSHTAPGQVMESAMPSMREPWNDPKRPTTVGGFPVTMLADLTFDIVRPHSHKFGYRYWVRAREHDLPTDTHSPWSGWDSFTIQEAPGTPLSPVSPGKPDYTIKGLKPPIVQAPKQNRIFVNQGAVIEVSPTLKHTDYSRWEYAFEWKREDYNTAANNAYAKRTYLKKYPNSSSYFPPTLGRNSSLQPWLSPARLRTMPENSGTTGGFQAVGSKAPTMSVHLNFSTLRSKRKDASYLYQFRVREYSRDSNAYGPWSPWRSFIVQERIGSPTLYHYYRGAGTLLPTVHALPRGTRGTIHGTTRGKPTVGLRHGIRQRGVRKKLVPAVPVRRLTPAVPVRRLAPAAPVRRLTPAAPAHRLAPAAPARRLTPAAPAHRLAPAAPVRRLTPAAPVRRLNLPAQLRLNR